MEEKKNVLRIEDGKVIKIFASHLDFVTESRIYSKLEGTGLCPPLIYRGEDTIEHEYAEGPLLFDELIRAVEDAEKLQHLFAVFIGWYGEFRRIAGCSLEHIDFRDFVLQGDRLVCVDFEACKPDFIESDLVKLTAQMYLVPKPFSREAEKVCRLFVRQAAQRFSLAPDLFSSRMRTELARICELLGIDHDAETAEGFSDRLAELIRSTMG